MPMRGRAMQPSTISQLLVRVDAFGENCFAGRLYSPYLERGATFKDIMDMVDTMDLVFDTIGFPVAAASYRSFMLPISVSPKTARNKKVPVPKFIGDQNCVVQPDEPGVFALHVQLRQNASWQGKVSFNNLPEQYFPSTLALIKMMSESLSQEQNTVGQAI